MRLRQKHRGEDPGRSLGNPALAERAGAAVFILFIAGLIAFATFVRLRPRPSRYEGVVVDKSITFIETQQGSRRLLQLHIKGRGGDSFSVKVNDDTYARARVGMWARNTGGGVELSWDEPAPGQGASKTGGAEPPSASAPR